MPPQEIAIIATGRLHIDRSSRSDTNVTSPFAPPRPTTGFHRLGGAFRRLAHSVGLGTKPEQYELFEAPEADKDRLGELIELISRHYVFTTDHYPQLPLDETRKLQFALRHCAFHFAKTAGQLATVCEAMDHGEDADEEALRALTPKSLINTLKLAELIGLSEVDLLEAACRRYRP